MALSIPPPPSAPVCYRFAGVRVDTAARRLWVDEVERRVQPLVFNLLWLLCEQPRQVVSRDVLFQRLWPDGSFPSDESLSQLVFKLRTLIAPYGGNVVTVRHVGIRLDADVRATVVEPAPLLEMPAAFPMPADPPAAAANDAPRARAEVDAVDRVAADPGVAVVDRPAPVRTSATRVVGPRRYWPRRVAVALALVVVLVVAVRGWLASEVDPGFGLRVADLGTWRPSSASGIGEALAADARGDRARAVALMQSVHAADANTPVPALFLATWWATAGDARAPAMAEAYRARLGAQAPAFLHHLGVHLLGSTPLGAPSQPVNLDLLLAARPRARRLLLARAHWHLGEVEADAALADLRAIAIDDLADRIQWTALIDRISLGDGESVATVLRGLPATDADARAARVHVQGWLALAAGDAAGAASMLAEGADHAAEAGLGEAERRLRLAAAIAAGRVGDFAAVRVQLGRTRALAIQQQRPTQALQAGLLLLALPDWDVATRAAMAAELARLPAVSGGWECLEIRLAFALTALPGQPCPTVALPTTASLRGLDQLLEGYAAWQAGDLTRASTHLAAARAQGAGSGLLGPWAGLLAERIGEPEGAAPGLNLQPLLVTQGIAWWTPPPKAGSASVAARAASAEQAVVDTAMGGMRPDGGQPRHRGE